MRDVCRRLFATFVHSRGQLFVCVGVCLPIVVTQIELRIRTVITNKRNGNGYGAVEGQGRWFKLNCPHYSAIRQRLWRKQAVKWRDGNDCISWESVCGNS